MSDSVFLTYLVHSPMASYKGFLLLVILKGAQNSSSGLSQRQSPRPTPSQLSPLWKELPD